ncbi:K+ channel tetramerization subfamily protein [Acanthamoeba castellanii str. Neff]|uniref:K+ channel tetramerisation subfamily protein n=1 Tax=Acanthamoeba castellanii (strain ATCC 30010 / Neff) TaxID=1257118 RepID=M0QSN8_ACACF|nr:K+ channel tetramerization subfamily protein [Acanthamoeba castellanii str. Neff]ELR22584.1 K+ channel tetramerisation subfamily protein [Acanthamoeba castellanii str. Neff]
MASIESSGRIGGELVCVVFPDGVEVAAALDDRGTVDLDCLHPHALGLQEEEQPFMNDASSSEQHLGAASSSSSSHSALRPLRIGRDVPYHLLHHHLNTAAQPVVGGGGGGGGVEAQELREVKALLRSLLASGSGPSATTTATSTATASSTFVDEAAASDRIPLASFFTSAPLPSDGGAGAESASPSPATAARSLALAPPPPPQPAAYSPAVVPTCRHACGAGESGGDAGVPSSGSGEGSKRTKRKDSKQKRMETATSEATDNGEASGEIVRVNVGGKEFITLRSTLCRFDGTFLEAVFSGRHRSVRDSMGRCFIDRHVADSLFVLCFANPQHFQVILDFLRDPTMTCPELPSQKEERQAFLREVEYYGLKEVMVGEKKEAELLCEQGYAFYNGRKVSKDYRKAVELWQRAAELGEARAQNRLAMCYKNGEGVEQDLYKAIPLFQKAAEQGLRDAQYNLACIYKNGEGVGVDLTKAILWFRRAEAQGDTDARRMLETLASLASASS